MSKLKDLTGQDFGYWHVIERAKNDKNGKAMWLCLCTKCGKTIKPVLGTHLRAGRSKACQNCRMQKMAETNRKDETGKIYGFLKVERLALEEEKPRHDKTGAYWNCTCTKCGRKNVIVLGDYLRKGETSSCGCINSKNESLISQMLDNSKINYKQQVTFEDLTLTGRSCDKLKFDFGIYNNNNLLYLIEYDGIQHFSKQKTWGQYQYEEIHKKDLLKNQYCFIHNIPLIRIPFSKEYSLNSLRIDTTEFLLTPENEQEYYKLNTEEN